MASAANAGMGPQCFVRVVARFFSRLTADNLQSIDVQNMTCRGLIFDQGAIDLIMAMFWCVQFKQAPNSTIYKCFEMGLRLIRLPSRKEFGDWVTEGQLGIQLPSKLSKLLLSQDFFSIVNLNTLVHPLHP